MEKTIITLSNGKRVANFSSPHPFTFTDGSVLPAVSEAEAKRLKVTFLEQNYGNGDVELSFDLSNEVHKEMDQWRKLYKKKKVDVVFCPLPMIMAIKQELEYSFLDKDIRDTPFRAIRLEDRINKLASIEKQCV